MPVVIDTFEALPNEAPSAGPEGNASASDSRAPNAESPEVLFERLQVMLSERASRLRAH